VLTVAALGPVLVGYLAVALVVSGMVMTAGAPWSPVGVLRVAAPCWLAVHQVPLTVASPDAAGSGAMLGVLPLLPTIGMAALVARVAAGAVTRLGWSAPAPAAVLVLVRLAVLAGVIGGVHGAVGVLVAVLGPSSRLSAAPLAAFVGCAAFAAGAALVGGLRAARSSTVLGGLLPEWAMRGVRAGLIGVTVLLAAGAMVALAGLAFSAGAVHDGVAGWRHTPAGPAGITALSIAYLPNAAVGALSWTAGPGLSIGAVSVSPFGATAATLPAVPLLAALPGPGGGALRPIAIAVPLMVGALVGRCCRTAGATRTDRLNAAAAAAATAAAGCFVLAVLAGGRLGDGAFDPVRIPPASLAIAVFVWLVIPACGVAALPGRSWRPANSPVDRGQADRG
jgi:hypothetical protein